MDTQFVPSAGEAAPSQNARSRGATLLDRVSRLSRTVHLWMGLALAVYLGWMGGSGVLLNHPELMAGVTVPEWLVPFQYRIDNWNRGSLRSLVEVKGEPRTLLAAGRVGVWSSTDGGETFADFNQGLGSLFERNASHLLVLDDVREPVILVATRGGLFRRGLDDSMWSPVSLGDERPVVKLVRLEERVLAFSDSSVFAAPLPPSALEFRPVGLERRSAESRIDLTDYFFGIHSGEAWGLPGRLVYDVIGLVLVFLSVTAVVTWVYRKARKRLERVRRSLRPLVRWLVRYHLDLGIWSAVVLLVIGGTGIFMRPPLLALLADGSVPRWSYPGVVSQNPWYQRIQNAAYDAARDRVLIQADDGIWEGPPDLDRPFEEIVLPVPVFAMGATVFEADGDGALDVGSFAGLFRVEANGRTRDLINGGPPAAGSQMRPGDHLVTGFVSLPGGQRAITTHYRGLLAVDGTDGAELLRMPELTGVNAGMPLWNFMFELHNGRIFRDVIGEWYVLITPLGGLCLILLTLTGVWDWAVPKFSRRR